MKLLVVASSLDLRAPLGSTPSIWQLLKALAEQGVDLVVAPYQGSAIQTPWWTSAPNPCQREGDVVGVVKRHLPAHSTGAAAPAGTLGDKLAPLLVEHVTKPRWRDLLMRLLAARPSADAVLFLMVPPGHFAGIPRLIERRFGVPSFFYDGDLPASLPSFAGFQTGFKIYDGADLSEYAALFSTSKGSVDHLLRLGAREVHVVYYAADPLLLSPRSHEVQDIDVFFYGFGREYRETWIDAMLGVPSQQLPGTRFVARGTNLGALPFVEHLPNGGFSKLGDYCRRSRINLLITRQAHASVYASSTARPFELAALGCAMVSNPYLGIEEWFEPGKEILVVHDAREATDTYRALLASVSLRRELGARARKRLLAEHTYQHRANQLLQLLNLPKPSRTAASYTASVC